MSYREAMKNPNDPYWDFAFNLSASEHLERFAPCAEKEPCRGCVEHPHNLDHESKRAADALCKEFCSSEKYDKTKKKIVQESQRFCEEKGKGHLAWAVAHLLVLRGYVENPSDFETELPSEADLDWVTHVAWKRKTRRKGRIMPRMLGTSVQAR